MLHPLTRPVELDEPAVVHDAVDERGGELVVAEHDAPFGELDVGGDHQAPLFESESAPDPLTSRFPFRWTGTILWTSGIELMSALPLIFHGR